MSCCKGSLEAALLPTPEQRVRPQENKSGRKQMIRNVIWVMLVLCFSSFALADTSSHRQAAEEVLLLTNVDKMMDPLFRQIQQMQIRQLQQMNLPPEAYEFAQKYIQRINELMAREFQWQRMKNDYISLYLGVFSEPELRDLIKFYKTPLGQKLIEKTPLLIRQSMQLGQQRTISIMPEIQAISDEMIREIQQKYQSQ